MEAGRQGGGEAGKQGSVERRAWNFGTLEPWNLEPGTWNPEPGTKAVEQLALSYIGNINRHAIAKPDRA
jgi:hypothetical protein